MFSLCKRSSSYYLPCTNPLAFRYDDLQCTVHFLIFCEVFLDFVWFFPVCSFLLWYFLVFSFSWSIFGWIFEVLATYANKTFVVTNHCKRFRWFLLYFLHSRNLFWVYSFYCFFVSRTTLPVRCVISITVSIFCFCLFRFGAIFGSIFFTIFNGYSWFITVILCVSESLAVFKLRYCFFIFIIWWYSSFMLNMSL